MARLDRFVTIAWRGSAAGLVAGLAVLPGAVGVAVCIFYFGDWPQESGVRQVIAGFVAGGIVWLAVSLGFLRGFGDVRKADGAAHAELVMRLTSLEARLKAMSPSGGGTAYNEAHERIEYLRRTLHPSTNDASGSPLQWLGGYGYINLWRSVHRAEEALLGLEQPPTLYVSALQDETRLRDAAVDSKDVLLGTLLCLLGAPERRCEDMSALVEKLDSPVSRAVVREVRFVLNVYRDELWNRYVRIRNRMFETLVYTGLVFDGILALAIGVLARDERTVLAVGLTYYLVGALVGLFAELYGTSRGQRSSVHDYGLATVRILTIPVLSGIAAVGGVAITRLGGTAGTDATVALEDVFSIHDYPLGLIVAAVFGLTPGLLLGRLRAQSDETNKALVQSAPGTQNVSASGST